MAGSPKKRARKEARLLALAQGTGSLPQPETAAPAGQGAPAMCADGAAMSASPTPGLPAPIEEPAIVPEVLPPGAVPEPTRTAARRAMRRKAEQYADEAIEVLAQALKSKDERVRVNAANDILDRAHGKPTPEIDAGDGSMQIVILRFGDQVQ